MSLALLPLRAQPQWAPTLADWHYREWGALFGDSWSPALALAELEQHAATDSLASTLIAVDGGDLLGSVSVLLDDAAELSHLGSPWLASLYVRPALRGHGTGARLVQAALDHAAQHDVQELLLFTPQHADFYRRLGWRVLCPARVNGQAVTVMACSTRGSP